MAAYRNIYQFSIVSQNGDDVDIFISKKNYAGVCYQRSLGRAPMLKRERNGNILGTSLEIYAECKVDGEFSQLYTSSADEFLVKVYRNRVLQWTGFVSPELYSEPDIAPPYDVQIIATDGLGELKNYDFAQGGDSRSFLGHLNAMLSHTSLELDIEAVSGLQYYDDSWVDNTDMLSIVVDMRHLEAENCYDVLQITLASVNACITQQGGKWVVLRESDIYALADRLSPKIFGAMSNSSWWPIGNLSTDIIPAKKSLNLTAKSHYKSTVLGNSQMKSDALWEKELGATYEVDDNGYRLPESLSAIRQKVDFHTEVNYRLRLSVSARNIGEGTEPQMLGVVIKAEGRMSSAGSEFWLKELTEGRGYAWDVSEGGIEVELSAPSVSDTRSDANDVDIVIPLYSYSNRVFAYATSIEVTLINLGGNYPIGVYRCSLSQYDQSPGNQIQVLIGNEAREDAGTTDIAFGDGEYTLAAGYVFRYGIPLAYNSEGIIKKWRTPSIAEGAYLSVLARDYAMQVALPRMRYRGKLNVPSMATPSVPMIFERDATYYFLNTYSYDLLNDELEVELISIPNASVVIESETITELPSAGSSGSSSSGSSGGGGTSGGGGSSTLAGLADVQVGNAQNGQALVYENGYWVPRTVSGGGSLSADAIISALGYTPLNADSFTKANLGLGNVDNIAANKYFTALSSDATNAISATIGGTNKTITAAELKTSLGLGSLAYKSSLVASDIPSLPWSKITSGKPTTLSGYGITDGLVYSDYINLASAYRHIGYGYTSIGWKTSGPAAVFGTALYNLRMQCAISNTDTPYVYVSQMYNGVAKEWAELVTYEGAAGKEFDALKYKIGGTDVLQTSGNNVLLNYGNRTTGSLYLYGTSLYFYLNSSSIPFKILDDGKVHIAEVPLTRGPSGSLKAGAYEALQYFSDGKLIMHRNLGAENLYFNYGGAAESMFLYGSEYTFHLGSSRERVFSIFSNKNAMFKADLTVAGNMYSKNYPGGKALSQDPTSSFISTIFDADAVGSSGYRLRIVKALEAGFDRIIMPYSPMVVIKSNDTHGFISFGYNEAGRTRCYIGGGNADKLNWSAALFHDNMSLLPKDDNTYALGDSSHRWSNVNAVNINAYGNIVLTGQLLGTTPAGGTYPRVRIFSDASYYWMQIGSYDGLSAEGSMTICGIYGAGLKTLRLIASNTIIGGASQFVSLATFDAGIKIGEATLTWDAVAGMLKIDKGVYSEGAITAKKKA